MEIEKPQDIDIERQLNTNGYYCELNQPEQNKKKVYLSLEIDLRVSRNKKFLFIPIDLNFDNLPNFTNFATINTQNLLDFSLNLSESVMSTLYQWDNEKGYLTNIANYLDSLKNYLNNEEICTLSDSRFISDAEKLILFQFPDQCFKRRVWDWFSAKDPSAAMFFFVENQLKKFYESKNLNYDLKSYSDRNLGKTNDFSKIFNIYQEINTINGINEELITFSLESLDTQVHFFKNKGHTLNNIKLEVKIESI